MRRSMMVLIACGLLATGSACSDDGGESSATSTSDPGAVPAEDLEADGEPNEVDLEAAVRAYTTAFGADDPDSAVVLLTERCVRIAEAAVREGVSQIAAVAPGLDVTSFSADIDGYAATVDYEVSDPQFNQSDERWLIEGGAWRNDDC